MNLVEGARQWGVGKIVMAGSVCAYPEFAQTPMRETDLWNGYPEPTNGPYGVAKRVAHTMLDAYHRQHGGEYAYLLLTNLFGPGDNFDPETSHAIPAIIRKVAHAKQYGANSIVLWGTGQVTRDFLYVDDATAAFLAAGLTPDTCLPINVGSGQAWSIAQVAQTIADIMHYPGRILFDQTSPSGQVARQLNIDLAAERLSWTPTTYLADGLEQTIRWYMNRREQVGE
jgi:GDP-L-fucose synthase